MIKGLALQTDSPDPAIRGWGCIFSDYAAIVQDATGVVLSADRLARAFSQAVAAGAILSNDIPVGTAGWYRAFVIDPRYAMRIVAEACGKPLVSISGGAHVALSATPGGAYTIIEYATKTGSHFRLGRVNADLSIELLYDPGPKFRVGAVKTVRHWRVTA